MVDQNRQIRLDCTPNHLNIHIQIFVGEQVAEVNNLPTFRDRLKQLWIPLRDQFQGFADDDELTLNGRTNQPRLAIASFTRWCLLLPEWQLQPPGCRSDRPEDHAA